MGNAVRNKIFEIFDLPKLIFSAAYVSNQNVPSDTYRQFGSSECSQTMLSPNSVQITREYYKKLIENSNNLMQIENLIFL